MREPRKPLGRAQAAQGKHLGIGLPQGIEPDPIKETLKRGLCRGQRFQFPDGEGAGDAVLQGGQLRPRPEAQKGLDCHEIARFVEPQDLNDTGPDRSLRLEPRTQRRRETPRALKARGARWLGPSLRRAMHSSIQLGGMGTGRIHMARRAETVKASTFVDEYPSTPARVSRPQPRIGRALATSLGTAILSTVR
jgi:hypothetical protein